MGAADQGLSGHPGNKLPSTENDTVTDIYFRIATLTSLVSNLREANNSNVEKIERLEKANAEKIEQLKKDHMEKIEQLTLSTFAIPYLETAVAKNEEQVNGVGKRHDEAIKDLQHDAKVARWVGRTALVLISPVVATIILGILAFGWDFFKHLFRIVYP
jgi:hypothetical protein